MHKAQIYAQGFQHEEAYIVGDRASLERILEATRRALLTGRNLNSSKAELMCADGEGFDLHVILLEDEATWHSLAAPYTDENATGPQEDKLWPSALLK